MESGWAFGGVQVPLAEAAAVLIPAAYDLTSSYGSGARRGPRAILEASTYMELFDETLGFAPTDVGVHTGEILEQVASSPVDMARRIADAVGAVLDAGRMPILLGGDHSVSNGSFLALEERGLRPTVVQFDAHADLREEYQGTPMSHACVMARARERFPCVQLGIRSLSKAEFDRVGREDLPLFFSRALLSDREGVLRNAGRLVGEDVYLTIDLDVLDPSIMPATGTPEPGGLGWEDLLAGLEALTRGRRVVGFDLVELAPIPGMRAPDFLAAKLVNKVLGFTRPRAGGR